MKQRSSLDTNVNTFNTFDESPKEVYIIISQRSIKEKGKRFFGLTKLNNEYKINVNVISRLLLDGVKNMNEFINNSLTFQKEKIEKKKQQDEKAHEKRNKVANWRNKVKKIGKKKLSSE